MLEHPTLGSNLKDSPVTCSVMLFRTSWGLGFGAGLCFGLATGFGAAVTLGCGAGLTGAAFAGAPVEPPVAEFRIAADTSSFAACLAASSPVGPLPCVTATSTGSAVSGSCDCWCRNSSNCCLHTCAPVCRNKEVDKNRASSASYASNRMMPWWGIPHTSLYGKLAKTSKSICASLSLVEIV